MKKLTLFLVAATLGVAATAQTPTAPAPAPTGTTPAAGAAGAATAKPKPLSVSDKKFIKDASDAILVEQKYLAVIENNKTLTLPETTTRDVTKMTGELKRIWTALATLATDKGAEVAQNVEKADQAKIDKLGKEKPDKFQKEFFKDFGKETKKTVKLFESSKTLQDADVKKFADDWATVIKGHDLAAETGEKAATAKKK